MIHRTHRLVAGIALGACLLPAAAAALPPSQVVVLNGFDPVTRAAVARELAACPACQLERLSDGTPNILMPPSAEPRASLDDAPPASGSRPAPSTACAPNNPTLDRNAEYFRRLGSSWFGVYYSAASRASAAPVQAERAYHGDVVNAVGASVFDHNLDIARAESSADARSGGFRRTAGRVYIRSSSGALTQVPLVTSSASGAVTLPQLSRTREFWRGDYAFTLGPLPVVAQGSVKGTVAYVVSSSTGPRSAAVTGAPTVSLTADADLHAEFGVGAAGVRGLLTIAQGSLPTSASMNERVDGAHAFSLASSIDLTLLSGRLDAFLRLGFGPFSKTWSHNLTRWSGITTRTQLYSVQGVIARCGARAGGPSGGILL